MSWLIPRRSHTFCHSGHYYYYLLLFPESSKCRVGFGESVIDFYVNVGFYGEGASQVGERIGSFQWLVIHKDVWLVIHLSRCRLVHDFCLLGADGKTKVVASFIKVIHALLHFRFSAAVKSTVICKEESPRGGYLHLCVCFESSEVEHSSTRAVLRSGLSAFGLSIRVCTFHDPIISCFKFLFVLTANMGYPPAVVCWSG